MENNLPSPTIFIIWILLSFSKEQQNWKWSPMNYSNGNHWSSKLVYLLQLNISRNFFHIYPDRKRSLMTFKTGYRSIWHIYFLNISHSFSAKFILENGLKCFWVKSTNKIKRLTWRRYTTPCSLSLGSLYLNQFKKNISISDVRWG